MRDDCVKLLRAGGRGDGMGDGGGAQQCARTACRRRVSEAQAARGAARQVRVRPLVRLCQSNELRRFVFCPADLSRVLWRDVDSKASCHSLEMRDVTAVRACAARAAPRG